MGLLLRGFQPEGQARRRLDSPGDAGLRIRHKLALLRALLLLPDPRAQPTLHPFAPKGHALRDVEEALGLELGDSLELLEDLADLGLLKRELFNHVNLCPHCSACQINFREACPSCRTLEISIERLVHHFACAHVGPESEFSNGIDLVCPKCERVLHQLGQDFDRPGETFLCKPHGHIFEEPLLEGQCFGCTKVFGAHRAEVQEIFSYRATPLASRAVELNRLTGLDVAELLQEAGLGVATRTFFLVEMERELLRLEHQPGSFGLATLDFHCDGKPYAIFRHLKPDSLRALTGTIAANLRSLDLACRWDPTRMALLLLGADSTKCASIRLRIQQHIDQLVLLSEERKPLEVKWRLQSFTKAGISPATAMAFLEKGVALP